jgi:hypothetical protein
MLQTPASAAAAFNCTACNCFSTTGSAISFFYDDAIVINKTHFITQRED